MYPVDTDTEVSWCGEGSLWNGRHNSTSARGMSLGSTAEAMSGVYCRGNVCCHCGLLQRHCPLSLGSTAEVMSVVTAVYCRGNVCKPIVVPLCPPAWECIHPSFKTTMQEHLLSKITCSLAESGLPHHSPQTCLRLKTCANCLGDMSGDGLTSQRATTSSLMNWRNGVEYPMQPLGSSWDVIVSRAWHLAVNGGPTHDWDFCEIDGNTDPCQTN